MELIFYLSYIFLVLNTALSLYLSFRTVKELFKYENEKLEIMKIAMDMIYSTDYETYKKFEGHSKTLEVFKKQQNKTKKVINRESKFVD